MGGSFLPGNECAKRILYRVIFITGIAIHLGFGLEFGLDPGPLWASSSIGN